MPEGPSIVILKEEVQAFTGKKIITVSGNSKKIDINRLLNKKVIVVNYKLSDLVEIDSPIYKNLKN